MELNLKFKKGDKVVLLKNISQREFLNFGCETFYIEEVKKAKYLTIRTIMDEEPNLNFYEVEQWWKPRWFKKFNTQLELNFKGEEDGR